jgi:hypothetical protein
MINPSEVTQFYARYPHLKDKIQLTWGTRECRRVLTSLINDTRDGERTGFSRLDSKIIFSLLDEHDKKFPHLDSSKGSVTESPFNSYPIPVKKLPPSTSQRAPLESEDGGLNIYGVIGATTTILLVAISILYNFFHAH